MLEAESNKRGFLLSGDSTFVYKSDQALQTLKTELEVLSILLADNEGQIKNLINLEKAIDQKRTNIKNNWNIELV